LQLLPDDLGRWAEQLSQAKNGKWIRRALEVLVRLAGTDVDRLDWKILTAALEDLEQGFQVFAPYRHIRKVSFFGSARLSPQTAEYRLAAELARLLSQHGFMTITGAGGGIMQAGNEGAGRANSFGLNIQLPFEQGANACIEGDSKLIDFKYFFTRKLFFMRESDAIVFFPGGFGTQDEAFECLTLCQTGKGGPVPIVLIDKPSGTYWQAWNDYLRQHLIANQLIGPHDTDIFTVVDSAERACKAIQDFYRVYHSSRYVGETLVIRLNQPLSDRDIDKLNAEFSDILVDGKIAKSNALPQEARDATASLPRLTLHFNQRDLGRLYGLIRELNRLGVATARASHPERK